MVLDLVFFDTKAGESISFSSKRFRLSNYDEVVDVVDNIG